MGRWLRPPPHYAAAMHAHEGPARLEWTANPSFTVGEPVDVIVDELPDGWDVGLRRSPAN